MIIVGSSALHYHGINITPKDIDAWSDIDPRFIVNSDADYTQMPREILDMIPTKGFYATIEAVLTIKMSHLSWDIKWNKTKRHILLLTSLGYDFIPDLYYKLKSHWELVHGNKSFLSLGRNKDKFFNDYVEYKYDHDYLHELVSFPERPIYTKCLQDNEEVLTSHAKFLHMSFDDKIRMFREEITVIAVERWLVYGRESWYSAYGLSLQKTITNLTKNWANDFIIFNLEHFIEPKYEYFENILKELNMSNKVDLAPFDKILEDQVDIYDNLEQLIYSMCSGDFEPTNSNCLDEVDSYERLDQEGGGDGGSEYCYGVFEFKGKIYKAEYSYYSHEGHDYGDIVNTLQEVKAVETTITVYV